MAKMLPLHSTASRERGPGPVILFPCTCPCCRHRNRQFEERLEHLEARKRAEARQCRAEMAHVPFERVIFTCQPGTGS